MPRFAEKDGLSQFRLSGQNAVVLFRPSANVVKDFPKFPVITDHAELRKRVEKFLAG